MHGIAYITAQDAGVAPGVRGDPGYLRPRARDHLLWSDFYDDREASSEQGGLLTRELVDLFRHYGFEPPKPEIGDLRHPDPATAKENRRNFAKLWEATKTDLRKMGWRRIGPPSTAELYVAEGTSKRVKNAWLDPIWARGLLRVRLTPHTGKGSDVNESLQAAPLPHRDDLEIQRRYAGGRVRDPEYVQVAISLRKLLDDAHDTLTIKRLLAEFVAAVFRAAG